MTELRERLANWCALWWRRALEDPTYDNGSNDLNSNQAMAMMSARPKNNTPDVLDRFQEALAKKLLNYAVESGGIDLRWKWGIGLHSDYQCDQTLSEIAKSVGPDMQFPLKTSTHVFCDEEPERGGPPIAFLQTKAGYAAEILQHYPISGGRWFITTLHGSPHDIQQLVRWVERGNPPDWAIVTAPGAALPATSFANPSFPKKGS